MPRTTIDIDASVLRELKKLKERDHKSLGEVASELLAKAMKLETEAPQPLNWTSRDLQPKVDLDDKEAVWRILDSEWFLNDRGHRSDAEEQPVEPDR